MIRDTQYFKDLFQVGYKITQADYHDWLDSYLHALAEIPVTQIAGLAGVLANYRLKNTNIPAAEIDGLAAAVSTLTANFLTTASAISMAQITGLTAALSSLVSAKQAADMISQAVNRTGHATATGGNYTVQPSDYFVLFQTEDVVVNLPNPADFPNRELHFRVPSGFQIKLQNYAVYDVNNGQVWGEFPSPSPDFDYNILPFSLGHTLDLQSIDDGGQYRWYVTGVRH